MPSRETEERKMTRGNWPGEQQGSIYDYERAGQKGRESRGWIEKSVFFVSSHCY